MTLIKPLLLLSKRTTHVHILCTPESPNDGVLQSAICKQLAVSELQNETIERAVQE